MVEFAAKFYEEGTAVLEQRKYALYQHIGYKLSGTKMPYIAFDFISSNRIQIVEARNIMKLITGVSFSPAARAAVKAQFEVHRKSQSRNGKIPHNEYHKLLIFQLAVGI